MSRKRTVATLGAGAVIAVAGVVTLAARHDDAAKDRKARTAAAKSYAELVAANYRVLSPAQTRRLLRFAAAFYACASKRSSAIGEPKSLGTKIELPVAAGADEQATLHVMGVCGDKLGGPPARSSLVLVKGGEAIELYLPKYCLLDRKVVAIADAP